VTGSNIAPSPQSTLSSLARSPELLRVLLEHAGRGFRVQLLVRAILVVFIVLTVTVLPPAHARTACYVIGAGYASWAAALFSLTRRLDTRVLRLSWVALYVDVGVLAAVSLIASVSDNQSWTADVLINGFFLTPILAAVQLRLWAAVSVMVPNLGVYLVCSVAAQKANEEPTASIALRSLMLAGVCAACALLVNIQASRVIALGTAAAARTTLLTELIATENRERQQLSEVLHDGALQYVLAARQDLSDLPPQTAATTRQRIEEALRHAADELRSQVTEMSPAVLEQAGLPTALRRLADDTGQRGRLVITVTVEGWTESRHSAEDKLLFDTARELLANVVKHARASTASIMLVRDSTGTHLTISDDGVGLDTANLTERLAAGHIGLSSRRIRIEAAGGHIDIEPGTKKGTTVITHLPPSTSLQA